MIFKASIPAMTTDVRPQSVSTSVTALGQMLHHNPPRQPSDTFEQMLQQSWFGQPPAGHKHVTGRTATKSLSIAKSFFVIIRMSKARKSRLYQRSADGAFQPFHTIERSFLNTTS